MIIRLLFMCLPLVAWTQAIAQVSTASIISELNQQLEAPKENWPQANFQTEVVGADTTELKIGSDVWFRFKTQRDCYVTMVFFDSEALMTIYRVFGQQPLRASDGFKRFPANPAFSFNIKPPTGLDHYYAFCTSEYLDLSGLWFEDNVAEFWDKDVFRATNQILENINRPDIRFGRDFWTLRVVGRSEDTPYSKADIIQALTPTPSRGGAKGPRQEQPPIEQRPFVPKKLVFHINFDFDSTVLSPASQQILDDIGNAIKSDRLGTQSYILGGHTDSDGSEEYNLDLSRARAEIARKYLEVIHKIDPSRIDIFAAGESYPKADNSTNAGRWENRRVELSVLN